MSVKIRNTGYKERRFRQIGKKYNVNLDRIEGCFKVNTNKEAPINAQQQEAISNYLPCLEQNMEKKPSIEIKTGSAC
jgi:cytochrome c